MQTVCLRKSMRLTTSVYSISCCIVFEMTNRLTNEETIAVLALVNDLHEHSFGLL